MKRVAVLGAAGAIGKTVTETLVARGAQVRVVGRSEGKLREAFGTLPVELVSADLGTEQGLSKALRGVDAAIYTLGLPYTKRDFAQYPGMMQACVSVAKAEGVKALVLITNVYPYGIPQTKLVKEEHPRTPSSVKGEYRKQQEDVLLAAHEPNGLGTLSLRLPNFYGPDAKLSVANGIFAAAVRGKTADVLGPIDTPQEFIYTPDVGPVVAELLERPEAFGHAYNLAGASHTTNRQFTEAIYRAAGQRQAKMRVASKGMVAFLGLFSELMRELKELHHLLETPVLLDDAKLRAVLPNLKKTSYEDGIRQTVAAYAAEAKAASLEHKAAQPQGA